jgi:hypothetical protein
MARGTPNFFIAEKANSGIALIVYRNRNIFAALKGRLLFEA